MTIKEIEALSQMTRANIRFYEAEGLLKPQRSSNGYRDYSQEDLQVLQKIKLLRLEKQDIIPKVQAPWRRYFARSLDMAFYSTIWLGFLALAFRVNLGNRSTGGDFLDACVSLLMMLVLEPLQLSLWGTTLGKWMLGLRVTNNEDGRLSYSEAFHRTWQVFVYGMGLNIPIYYLYRNYKSYEACVTGVTLEWEYDSNLVIRDEKIWRSFVYVLIRGALVAALVLASIKAQTPLYREGLTVQQFCENYRNLETYYGMEAPYGRKLNDQGQWVEENQYGTGTFYVTDNAYPHRLDFKFEVDEKGEIRSVSFGLEADNSEKAIPDYRQQMQLAVLAFVGARKDFKLLSGDGLETVDMISKHNFEDFSFSKAGITVSCEVDYVGYEEPMPLGYLWPVEGKKQEFSMKFTMEEQ